MQIALLIAVTLSLVTACAASAHRDGSPAAELPGSVGLAVGLGTDFDSLAQRLRYPCVTGTPVLRGNSAAAAAAAADRGCRAEAGACAAAALEMKDELIPVAETELEIGR